MSNNNNLSTSELAAKDSISSLVEMEKEMAQVFNAARNFHRAKGAIDSLSPETKTLLVKELMLTGWLHAFVGAFGDIL